MLHKHNWIKIAKTYAPPQSNIKGSVVDFTDEKIVHGVTAILFQCEICQKLKQVEMLGKEIQ